jgi:hypothetical protein
LLASRDPPDRGDPLDRVHTTILSTLGSRSPTIHSPLNLSFIFISVIEQPAMSSEVMVDAPL